MSRQASEGVISYKYIISYFVEFELGVLNRCLMLLKKFFISWNSCKVLSSWQNAWIIYFAGITYTHTYCNDEHKESYFICIVIIVLISHLTFKNSEYSNTNICITTVRENESVIIWLHNGLYYWILWMH